MGQGIATLTVNPAIDVSTSVKRIEPFHKLRCSMARRDPGGGGINVARVLKRFGIEACAIYPTGGCTGTLLRNLVAAENVADRVIPIAGETRQDFTVVSESSGEQFRFVFPAPAIQPRGFEEIYAVVQDMAPRLRYLVVSGSLPESAPKDFLARIGAVANSAGLHMVLDTSGPALADALSQPLFLIKPNLREFQELTRAPLDTLAQRIEAARYLIAGKPVRMIALTLADEGALLVTAESAWFGAAPNVRTVSTVGAGDSFLGGFLSRIVSGGNPAAALRYGIAAGTAALLAPGTELCRIADVDRLLPQVSLREIP